MKYFTVALFALVAVASCAPADDVQSIDPRFDAYRDVRILLSTRENLGNPRQLNFRDLSSIQQSPFNPNRPTRVLIHGWFDDDTSDIKVETSRELLQFYDFNVIFIDWSEGSRTINYVQATQRVPPVGQFLASYLDFLHENNFLHFDRLSIIGFSLGAHMAGIAGKNVRRGKINTIIGLDPAGPLFSVNTPASRLDINDADYVENIHTNGGAMGSGIGAPIGHADFFPNGGSIQPGCIVNSCSHLRAVDLYIESINRNGFAALRCGSALEAAWGRCTGEPGAWFGGEPSNFDSTLRGIFHFTTNNRAPFSIGPFKPW